MNIVRETRDNIVNQIKNIIETKTKIDDELLLQLEEILLGADVGIDATERIIDGLRTRAKQDGFKTSNDVFTLLKEELEKIFVSEEKPSGCQEKLLVCQEKTFYLSREAFGLSRKTFEISRKMFVLEICICEYK